jgi:predicted glutamine amidotransferase
MCELFAMSALIPTRVQFSFGIFSSRGGQTGNHTDGWGAAFFDGLDCWLLREPMAAADSACAKYLAGNHIRSKFVVCHIRKATGDLAISLANTHPFEREVNGARIVFAHRGQFDGIHDDPAFSLDIDRPIGQTDSEHAFCYLLRDIRDGGGLDGRRLKPRLDALRARGVANVVISDGRQLVAYADKDMHLLQRHCPRTAEEHMHDLGGVTFSGFCGDQNVALIASVPLTDETAWEALRPGTLLVARDGVIVERLE